MSLPPRNARDFAAMVPKAVRDEVEAKVDKTESVVEEFAKKRRIAARAGGNNEAANAMAVDDANHARAVEVSKRQAKEAERDAREAELRKPKERRSRRRRKADAFAQRGERLRKRMTKHVQDVKDKLRRAGQKDADPIGVPVTVHGVTQAIMGDPTGHTARIKVSELPPDLARRVIKACLCPDPYEGTRKREGRELRKCDRETLKGSKKHWEHDGRRRWSHPAAIRTANLFVALYRMRRRTGRRGFTSVVRGIPRRMFAALAADGLTGVRPGLSALYGNMNGTPGAMRALAQAGAISIQQPPGRKVEACDRGPSGFAFNTYWFYSKAFEPPAAEPPEDAAAEVARLREAAYRYPESLRAELGLSPPPDAAQTH